MSDYSFDWLADIFLKIGALSTRSFLQPFLPEAMYSHVTKFPLPVPVRSSLAGRRGTISGQALITPSYRNKSAYVHLWSLEMGVFKFV
jgi:hypothetical protein